MASAFELLGVDPHDPEVAAGVEDFEELAHFVGELVRLRIQHGLKQRAVAEAMGTTQSVVSKLETVGGNPTVRSLQRYARAVGYCLELSARPASASAGSWQEASPLTIDDRIKLTPGPARVNRGGGPWRDAFAATA